MMMRKNAMILAASVLCIAFGMASVAAETEREQTQNTEVTEIATADELKAVNDNLSGNYVLTADIDLSGYDEDIQSLIVAITLDQFYDKFERIRENTKVVNIIIASVKDALSRPVRAGYMLTEGRKIQKIPEDAPVIRWKEFLNLSRACFYKYRVDRKGDDPAVILYSGGTTGTTKGIVLTNKNFNALGQQVVAANPMFRVGDKMLAAMPLFHGFGLGVCIHTMLSQGGRCILIPRFTAKSYAKQIVKYRCNFIAGVPTLYEALLRLPDMDGADLSCLKGVFSGGDSLSVELKKK